MEGNSRDSFVMGKISTPEFEHLDFPQMKGPRDFGHADHALKSFRFVPLVIHATATLAADRLCNLHPLALHRRSKQMCPLTVLQTANLKMEEVCTCNGWILESDEDIR